MAGQKKFYRLFKVAKELNVGTAMLVDHLQASGFETENSPNTKLSGEEYDILLKEFASEKLIKQRANQINEQRKEEGPKTPQQNGAPNPVEDENDSGILSADELRNTITKRKRRRKPGGQKTPETKPESVVEPKVTPTPKEEPKVEPKEIKEEIKKEEVKAEVPEVKPEPKKKDPVSSLKIVGKIDLDAIGKKKKPEPKKKKEPVVTEPPKQKKVTPPKKEEKPPVKKEPVKAKEETVKEKPPVVVESKKQPEVKETRKERPPKKQQPKKETKPVNLEKQPVVKPKQKKEEKPAEEKEEIVMRAGDRTPKLSGLNVLGKIELPGSKPKRKKQKDSSQKPKTEADKTKTTAKTTDKDEEGSTRRRRRRKRKRKPSTNQNSTKTDNKNSNNKDNRGNNKRGKKEKPSTKEVKQSIRTTLSQMNKGPSRNRQKLRRAKRDAEAAKREEQEHKLQQESAILELTEFITANEFANLIEVPVNDIITKSFQLGMMVSINQRLDAELLTIIAEEYGYETKFIDVTEKEFEIQEEADNPEDLKTRNPIITVMGHVDHGKTTLLDHLRKTNVTSQEAGGITQHIGAYQVQLKSGRMVTFLDTPGHEAFTAMRARGAKATDVVIVVIAADDAVMPQTKEAINHSQAAEVPMVFGFNKIDKAGADAERIKTQLAEMNLLVEDWGGKYQSQEISALKGLNVDELLEKVILEADLLELKANPDREASGTVIEARLDRGRGNVATVLVQNGTLSVGDELVAGIHYGKVRALINQNGERIKSAGPSTPVQVLGINGNPQAGDKFVVLTEDGKAKEIAQKRSELFREQQFRQTKRITLEEIGRRRAIGNFKELNIIIRGDVDGSVEALSGSLLKLSTDEVQVNILQKAVGAITEADINLAIASDAIVLAFNVRPNAQARSLADREEVDIRKYSVIYDAINDVKDALEGLLSPEIKEEIVGTAEVKEVFKITKVGNVAGSMVTSGKIRREDPIRIIRDGVVIYDSKLSSLKRFKEDVKEVVNAQEFGFMVENYNDIQKNDVLESYRVNEIRRKL